ncbi:hypothetical protein BTGOE1_08120 [Bacillus thuringiensis]|nr:hypothetical protein BTGOE1_08120 [Bacillus thuringiensis]OFC85644.1 hypothetical protein BTGOE2_08190 [Bacillus thuringiensis]
MVCEEGTTKDVVPSPFIKTHTLIRGWLYP